ncbi:SWIM zinc finger family protein [Nocardiopsis alborubida]|uniref:SWIM zinc finger family protein n=1 Tax=Nocardiopsis alborubida TaxID=146802 RepID=UPI000A82E93E|nr:SWIM zinc finger family protein [Nocardiopsis alborubida]
MSELSRGLLLKLAGRKSFDRGMDYLGRVSGLRADGRSVRATVRGQQRYRVRLTAAGAFSWHCDCPWAQGGNCCKHVVAVGLVHLYEREHGGGRGPHARPRPRHGDRRPALPPVQVLGQGQMPVGRQAGRRGRSVQPRRTCRMQS